MLSSGNRSWTLKNWCFFSKPIFYVIVNEFSIEKQTRWAVEADIFSSLHANTDNSKCLYKKLYVIPVRFGSDHIFIRKSTKSSFIYSKHSTWFKSFWSKFIHNEIVDAMREVFSHYKQGGKSLQHLSHYLSYSVCLTNFSAQLD